jgi:hypothetical protein
VGGRQTLVRGARKRGVEAGASNPDPDDKRLVDLTLRCASADAAKAIDEMVAFMRSGRHLNCWEAWIDQLDELPHGKPISECVPPFTSSQRARLSQLTCVCVCVCLVCVMCARACGAPGTR